MCFSFFSLNCAILEAVSYLSDRAIEDRQIVIHSDSQAALKALNTCCIRSYLVDECKRKLNALGSVNRLLLRWVKGHAGILGNEEADALARTGSDRPVHKSARHAFGHASRHV